MSTTLLKEPSKAVSWGGSGSFVAPSVIVEVEPGFVVAARLDRSGRRVSRIAAREVEAGALDAQLNRANLANPAELQRAVQAALGAIGNGGGRLGLLVPDPIVRAAILSFEALPDDRKEVEGLVRWRMKDLLPFPPDEARLAYQVLGRWPDCVEVLAMAAKNSVLAEYEAATENVNSGPGLILPATAALLPLVPEAEPSSQLLVHVCSGWMTTVLTEGSQLRGWRTREMARVAPEDLAGEVAREAARVIASTRDRLNLEVGRVWLCSRPPGTSELVPALASAVSCAVEPLPGSDDFASSLSTAEETLFKHFGATVAGLVKNSAKEA